MENMEGTTSINNTNSNLINTVRGMECYTGEDPGSFGNWHRNTGFILSIQRRDIFAVMEGQARPTEDESGEDEEKNRSTAPLLTPGLLYTAGGTLSQRCKPRSIKPTCATTAV